MATIPTTVLPIWRQIRWRLSASFVLLAVLPSLLVGFWISALALQDSEQHVTDQLESVADLKLSQIESWLSSSSAMLKLISGGPIGGELASLGVPGSPDGEAARVGALLAQSIQQTATADNGQPRFRSLFVYLPDRQIVAASDPNLISRVVTRQPYFAASLSGDTLQHPYYAIGTTELIMVMTTPIKDATGATTAVLASDINLTTLGTIMLERSGLGQSGETYLVSKESNYLLTPSRFAGYPQTRAYRSEGIERALSGEAGQGIYPDYRIPGVEVVGVYRWVPSLQAALLAEMDRAEVLAEAGPLQRLSLGLTIAASLIALALGLLVATRISSPLSNLTRVSEQIAHGDLSRRATIQSHDEIGALSIGFNHMADRLQGILADLELRIAERTTELRGALNDREHSLTELRESINAQNELRETVRRMSSPVLPVLDGVLVMPLVGIIDQDRADQLMGELLLAIEHQHAHTVILDVTGVPLVDTHVAAVLIQATNAVRLLGAESILVGIRPELAQTIVGLGVDLSSIQSLADLQSGILSANRRSRAHRCIRV